MTRKLSLHPLIVGLPLFVLAAAGSGPQSSCEADYRGEWYGEFFPTVPKVRYEGVTSAKPFAFRYYNATEEVLGRQMKDWLRFAVAFWHTFNGDGADPFGAPTKKWPWNDPKLSPMEQAFRRMHANFELMDKLGVQFWCFHDRDIAPEGENLEDTNENLDKVVEIAMELQKGSQIRPLWGTAQLFKHPRYMHGAATSSNVSVFAYAAAQVKKAMDVTQLLGGENFVFWGGREGYGSLLNTDLQLERDNLARFLSMAAAYRKRSGFKGALLLEPKPQEPTKHQYDWDVATTLGFLHSHSLQGEFKLNVECNHATLAGHSCEHELRMAALANALGGVDANTGDPQTGWDTDQFLTDPAEATRVMAAVVAAGGLGSGGINFDAKLRRESVDVEDIALAHIGAMDALARGLRNVAALAADGALTRLVADRYASWRDDKGLAGRIRRGEVGFEELEQWALTQPEPNDLPSAKAELADNIFAAHVR